MANTLGLGLGMEGSHRLMKVLSLGWKEPSKVIKSKPAAGGTGIAKATSNICTHSDFLSKSLFLPTRPSFLHSATHHITFKRKKTVTNSSA